MGDACTGEPSRTLSLCDMEPGRSAWTH